MLYFFEHSNLLEEFHQLFCFTLLSQHHKYWTIFASEVNWLHEALWIYTYNPLVVLQGCSYHCHFCCMYGDFSFQYGAKTFAFFLCPSTLMSSINSRTDHVFLHLIHQFLYISLVQPGILVHLKKLIIGISLIKKYFNVLCYFTLNHSFYLFHIMNNNLIC